MNNELIPFSFENKKIRVELIDGELCFVAQDVAAALEYPIKQTGKIGFACPGRMEGCESDSHPWWNAGNDLPFRAGPLLLSWAF